MATKKERSNNLLEATRVLLIKRDLTDVSKQTGLPYHWLRHLSAGRFKNPSVNRIQKLYEHLSGNKLEV